MGSVAAARGAAARAEEARGAVKAAVGSVAAARGAAVLLEAEATEAVKGRYTNRRRS